MQSLEGARVGRGPHADGELLAATRSGDTGAYAELWKRHHRAGLAAAYGMAPHLDAQDLVSEAFLKILALITDGRGPQGAFRPYMYRVIRSLASDWSTPRETPSDQLDMVPDLNIAAPWEDQVFDLNAAAGAYASLDERWRTVLWYTEVEGMPPREVARIMGISANSVSALASRARAALRSAWVEEHVNRELAAAECAETVKGLQRYQRGKLPAAASRAVAAHLDGCEACTSAAAELSMLNRQLALVIAGLVVGVGSASSLLSGLGAAAPAAAAVSPVLSGVAANSAGGAAATSASATGIGVGTTAASAGTVIAAPGIIAAAATVVLAAVVGASAVMLPELGAPGTSHATAAEADQGPPEVPRSGQRQSGDENEESPQGRISDAEYSQGTDGQNSFPDLPLESEPGASGDAATHEEPTPRSSERQDERKDERPEPKPQPTPEPEVSPEPEVAPEVESGAAPDPEPTPEVVPERKPGPEESDGYVAEYRCGVHHDRVVWVQLMNPPADFQRLRHDPLSGDSLSHIDILDADGDIIHSFVVDPTRCKSH